MMTPQWLVLQDHYHYLDFNHYNHHFLGGSPPSPLQAQMYNYHYHNTTTTTTTIDSGQLHHNYNLHFQEILLPPPLSIITLIGSDKVYDDTTMASATTTTLSGTSQDMTCSSTSTTHF